MNKIVRKVATVGVSVATVISLAGVGALAPVAGADTISDLQAQIAALTAQLNALAGGGGGACFSFTRSLTVGSQGADVTALQDYLTGTGHFTFSGGSTGYFGSITASAVASWQAANGVAPAVGYFGPISQAKYMTMCGTTAGTPGSASADLAGGAGSITLSSLPEYSSEEVGQGQDDKGVLAFELEADGSDVEVTSVRVEFVQDTAADSDKLTDYAKSVSIWFDGDMVGEATAKSFSVSSSDVWTKSISLDSGVIVREDKTGEFSVHVSALDNLDSGDIDTDDWNVDVLNVRFRDGDGVTTTEDADDDSLEQTFDFVSFATSVDLELQIKAGDDAVNDAHVIDVHATANTNNATLLSFGLRAEGNSDVYIKDLSINFDTVGVDLEDAVTNVSLWADGVRVGKEAITKNTATPGTDETIEFDKINFTIDAGDTVDFLVKADLRSIADGIADGDTISAQISATERALIDAEDESGEDLATADMTGAETGDAHAMFDDGIMVSFVSSSYVKTSSDTTGINETVEFSLVFDVTAFGDDIWVDRTCADNIGASTTSTTVSLTGDADGDNTTCTSFTSTGTTGTDGFQVKEGQTKRFTATVLGNGGEAGGAGTSVTFTANLLGVAYNVTTDAVADTRYAFNMANYKSGAVTVFDR